MTATPISEATIQAEIDLKTAEILESAYRQLEAQDALGQLPTWGPVFTIIFGIRLLIDAGARADIDAADGYGYVLDMYDDASGDEGHLAFGWDDAPYMPLALSGTIDEYEAFPRFTNAIP